MAITDVIEDDAASVLAYVEAIAGESEFLTFGPGEFEMSLADEIAFIRSRANPVNGLMLKAVIDDQIVGMAMLSRSPRSRLRHAGELGLSVRRASWGQGIGRALCEALFDRARATGVTRISLRVRADNARAIQLYERLGFQHEGRHVGAFAMGDVLYDELAMALRL